MCHRWPSWFGEEQTLLSHPERMVRHAFTHCFLHCFILTDITVQPSIDVSHFLAGHDYSSILGENSRISLNGKVAYVSQTAWILNRSMRENILFGLPYIESRYNRVIDTCCLRHDLTILEDGDLTEIGERGINLSGGELIYPVCKISV